ncbi:MAG: hypothetical protein LBN39_11770 [Planctomycetaceae bacterium]|jgi:hypothetical protein|nr:hypothetical protein [Planctomycetaceae bacterium]
MRCYRKSTEKEYAGAEDNGDSVAMTVWGRAAENAKKLVLLAACSENRKEPIIMPRHSDWAVQFIRPVAQLKFEFQRL